MKNNLKTTKPIPLILEKGISGNFIWKEEKEIFENKLLINQDLVKIHHVQDSYPENKTRIGYATPVNNEDGQIIDWKIKKV